MRIAQVCPYSVSVPGGVQAQALGLAGALRERGHDVVVIAPTDGPPPQAGVRSIGRTVAFAANGSMVPLPVSVASVRRSLSAFADEHFDVVHLHEPLAPGANLFTLALRPTLLVGTFHRFGPSQAYRWLRPIPRLLARRLDLRCAVSDEARQTAADALGGHYELVPNGVDVDYFAKATPCPSRPRTVLFIGRHERRKGLEVLLRASERLAGQGRPDLRLWIVGTGPQTDELRSRYARLAGVEWLGQIGDDEKAARLRGADAVCVPSLHGESFGVVLLEAMAAGTPVVASDLPAYRTVAVSGVDALLVPPGDAAGFAHALDAVLGQPVLAERLTRAAERRVRVFSMDRQAERYAGLYRDLVDRRSAGRRRGASTPERKP